MLPGHEWKTETPRNKVLFYFSEEGTGVTSSDHGHWRLSKRIADAMLHMPSLACLKCFAKILESQPALWASSSSNSSMSRCSWFFSFFLLAHLRAFISSQISVLIMVEIILMHMRILCSGVFLNLRVSRACQCFFQYLEFNGLRRMSNWNRKIDIL